MTTVNAMISTSVSNSLCCYTCYPNETSGRHSNNNGGGDTSANNLQTKRSRSLGFEGVAKRTHNDQERQPDEKILGAERPSQSMFLPIDIQSISQFSKKSERAIVFAAGSVPKQIISPAPAQREEVPKRIKLAAPAQREEVPKRIKLADTAQREEKSKGIRLVAPAQREKVPKEVISVKSDKDLLLRTTINKYGKKIQFKAADNYNGFTGKIGVTFPSFSVLGEEKVSLEIVPESLVHAYNERSKKIKSGVPEIITPILHIDRENDTSFLRDVEVSFPVFPKYYKILDKCQSSDKLLVENGKILLRESKFSPKAVSYDPVKGILRALRIDTKLSSAFSERGVYLLVEQFPKNVFLFDLRPFEDEEEHRTYRMDEKKMFLMILSPEETDQSLYGSKVSITVQEPAVLHNNHELRNVEGNKIDFIFPRLGCETYDFNGRKVTVVTEDQRSFFGVKFHFESHLLHEKGIDRIIEIPLHSDEDILKLSTRRLVQSEGMLLEFLTSLDSNWATFLAVYLRVELRSLKEFIARDIRLSLPPSNLNWSEEIKRQLKMETDLRQFQEVSCREQLVETMLKNYQSSNDLLKAKAEIFEILKNAEVLASDTECPKGLRPESREILASALMYNPVTELREAMEAAFVKGELFSPTPDVKKFIYDPEEPMEI